MDWKTAEAKIAAVDGLITNKEGKLLFDLARNCQGTIVEIGSWKGKSTICLALGSMAGNGAKVFAIDPHKATFDEFTKDETVLNTEPVFRSNIKAAGVKDTVTALVMRSDEAVSTWTKPICLLWIDGDHTFQGVDLDTRVWEPFLVEGGTICFHDCLYNLSHPWCPSPGVRDVVRQKIFGSSKFGHIRFQDATLCATKVSSLSWKDKVSKALKLMSYSLLVWVYYPIITLILRALIGVRLFTAVKAVKDKLIKAK